MRIDLGMSLVGDDGRGPQFYHHLHRADVEKRIKNHPAIDKWTKEYLLKRIAQYPDNALAFFVQNINNIVHTAINERTRVREEQNVTIKKTDNSEITTTQADSSGSGTGIEETQKEEIQEAKNYDPTS